MLYILYICYICYIYNIYNIYIYIISNINNTFWLGILIIYVAYCIFDMTPYESFLLIKNGSSNLKQLALVTFLLLQDLYILSYHPLNLTSSEIPEILTKTNLKRNLLNIERTITRYIHHKEFLQNYKANRKYQSNDLVLKFNLSLCTESPNLQKTCRNILRDDHSNYAIILSVVLLKN